MERIERFFFKKIDEIIDDKFVRKIKIPTCENKRRKEKHRNPSRCTISISRVSIIGFNLTLGLRKKSDFLFLSFFHREY